MTRPTFKGAKLQDLPGDIVALGLRKEELQRQLQFAERPAKRRAIERAIDLVEHYIEKAKESRARAEAFYEKMRALQPAPGFFMVPDHGEYFAVVASERAFRQRAHAWFSRASTGPR